MVIKTTILDGDGKGISSHVHRFAKGLHAGQIVLTEGLAKFDPEFHPFLNESFGTAMNQSVVFTGGSELITNGSDVAAWTTAIGAGTWDFNDATGKTGSSVSLTNGNNNDFAIFTDSGSTDFGAHTALTGQIRLETYNDSLNNLNLQFQLANLNIGNSVNLNDFIDTGLLNSYQGFVIPKEDFGITTQYVDELDFTLTRIGGTKPIFRFDDIQIEVSGTPLVFTADVEKDEVFCITELRIAIADVLASTVANGTMEGLSYDKLLDLVKLANGIIFQRIQNGKPVFSVTIKQLGDFLSTGSNLVNHISDGTNTFITLLIEFPEPIVLDGSKGDKLIFIINDDLSGLLQFTAAARGSIKKVDKKSILEDP
ncbi:MAG: hypothetical protein IIA87_03620 [Nanoarchaeota archaeon]|nr:hypothetical protein [Nanoarchaeota archaeon]